MSASSISLVSLTFMSLDIACSGVSNSLLSSKLSSFLMSSLSVTIFLDVEGISTSSTTLEWDT